MEPEQVKGNYSPDSEETNSPDSEETKKSLKNGKAVIELNQKISQQDGKDSQTEEKKDQERWRQEG